VDLVLQACFETKSYAFFLSTGGVTAKLKLGTTQNRLNGRDAFALTLQQKKVKFKY